MQHLPDVCIQNNLKRLWQTIKQDMRIPENEMVVNSPLMETAAKAAATQRECWRFRVLRIMVLIDTVS